MEKQLTRIESRFDEPNIHETKAIEEAYSHSSDIRKGALFILASGVANVLFTHLRHCVAKRYTLYDGMGVRQTDAGEALAREDLPRYRRGILGD